MAHVTGAISTLPGSARAVPEGQMCDDCGNKTATHRIQGETDSFGAEWHDLCDECNEVDRERRRQPIAGDCDWCKRHSDSLITTRDSDEGAHGPIYEVCQKCYDRQMKALEAELARYEEQHGYEDWKPLNYD